MDKLIMIQNMVKEIEKQIIEAQELRSKMAKMYGDFDTQTKIYENSIINLNNRKSELMAEYWTTYSNLNK